MNIFVLIILKLFKNSTGRVVYKRGMCPTDFLFWFHVWWFFFVLFFKFSIGQKKNLRVWRRRCRHARISARSGNVYLLYLSTSGQLFVKNFAWSISLAAISFSLSLWTSRVLCLYTLGRCCCCWPGGGQQYANNGGNNSKIPSEPQTLKIRISKGQSRVVVCCCFFFLPFFFESQSGPAGGKTTTKQASLSYIYPIQKRPADWLPTTNFYLSFFRLNFSTSVFSYYVFGVNAPLGARIT
jgi:hypothetical protein